MTAPAPAELPAAPIDAATGPKKVGSKAEAAFQRGLAALTQWVEREGQRAVPRGHSETITVDGETEPVIVKLGVWNSNVKSRRDKLSANQLAALAALGVDWAGAVQVAQDAAAQPAVQAAPQHRNHHDEGDNTLYEGGNCTCDLIEQYGPPSERDDY